MHRLRTPGARWTYVHPLALVAALALSGCDGDEASPTDPTDPLPPERVVASVSLDASELSVDVESTARLAATVRDQNGDPFATLPAGISISWSVGDAEVASVTPVGSGLEADVTGLAPGSTEVQATMVGVSGVSGSAEVTILSTFGTVTGIVTAANGTTPIQGALVRLLPGEEGAQGALHLGAGEAHAAAAAAATQTAGAAESGTPTAQGDAPEAITDSEGRYVLEGVPSGAQTLVATRGVFRAEFAVEVLANEEVEADPAPLDAEGALAYVAGAFDNIQSIVRDELGTELTRIDASDLASASVTSEFRFIFINCGVDDWDYLTDPAVRENLLAFMESGGAIYASDLEIELVDLLFPGALVETGEGADGTVTAEVVSMPLSDFIGGQETVQINFNLPGWASMIEVSDAADVLLRGDYLDDWTEVVVSDAPLAIAVEHGAGQLVYTSFHTNAAATDDQVSVLLYFIYGFGSSDEAGSLIRAGQPPLLQRMRTGGSPAQAAAPLDPEAAERHRARLEHRQAHRHEHRRE